MVSLLHLSPTGPRDGNGADGGQWTVGTGCWVILLWHATYMNEANFVALSIRVLGIPASSRV